MKTESTSHLSLKHSFNRSVDGRTALSGKQCFIPVMQTSLAQFIPNGGVFNGHI